MTKRVKYLLIEIIFFSVLTLFLFIALRGLLAFGVSHSNNAQTAKVNLIMQHKLDPQIIIFGSSVAEVGFNSNLISKITQKSVYNAAIDGTRFDQYRYLIDELIDYSKNTEIIALGLSFFSLSPADKLTEPSRFYAYLDQEPIKDMFYDHDKTEYYKLKYLPFYTFSQYKHTYYKNSFIGFYNSLKHKKLAADSLNGFVPHYSSWYGNEINVNNKKEKIYIKRNTLYKINCLIENIKKENKKIILIICPLYYKAQKKFSNYTEFKNTILSFRNKGAIVFDYSTIPINYNKDFFYNNGHLNFNGANKLSSRFANDLKNILNESNR